MIEIDINKFPKYPEISRLLGDLLADNKQLETKIIYLQEVLKKVVELNSLGKSLRVHDLCKDALEKLNPHE